MNDDNDFNKKFENNGASEWYRKHEGKLKSLIDNRYYTLPVAAAYNAGFAEALKKVRNNTCHTLQTKND